MVQDKMIIFPKDFGHYLVLDLTKLFILINPPRPFYTCSRLSYEFTGRISLVDVYQSIILHGHFKTIRHYYVLTVHVTAIKFNSINSKSTKYIEDETDYQSLENDFMSNCLGRGGGGGGGS